MSGWSVTGECKGVCRLDGRVWALINRGGKRKVVSSAGGSTKNYYLHKAKQGYRIRCMIFPQRKGFSKR